ncbi:MAG: DUF2637 domain-containing protein [Trebonia sp.]
MRRLAAVLADSAPVVVLAAIAGAGSFTHIRDTAAQHGQGGPMAWAVAVCIDLTCVMAARERQRDKRHGGTRRLSWPTVVLAGGILLSLAANLAQAQPDAWGRITAATPSGAFLVAVSMLERRASRPAAAPPVLPVPVPGEDRQVETGAHAGTLVPVPSPPAEPSGPPSAARPAAALVDFARRVAAEHEQAHGQPITRDKLRARLGISSQLASDLLREIRTA